MSSAIGTLLPGPVLVTGGTGFVGRHLLASLRARSAPPLPVRVLARSPEQARRLLPDTALTILPGDLTDPASLASACEGVATVFHGAAAMPGQPGAPSDLAGYRRVNVEGTLALARAAARAGAGRFVFLSSTAAMGAPSQRVVDETTSCRPTSPYEVTKRAAEEGLLALGAETPMRISILRPCVIAGAGQRGGVLLKLFRLCRRGLFPVVGGRLDVQKPLVAVEDVVQALLRAGASEAPRGLYLVTSGERHSLREILTVAGRLVGRDRPFRAIPLPLARLGAALTTPLARAAGIDPPLSPERLDLFLADRAIDIARARAELGYAPAHTALEPMLAQTHAWYRESGQL